MSYWKTGTIHILEGQDRLLFLLTLLLIVSGFIPLLKTVTAFTLAHSLTLALARATPYAIGGIAAFWTIDLLGTTFIPA